MYPNASAAHEVMEKTGGLSFYEGRHVDLGGVVDNGGRERDPVERGEGTGGMDEGSWDEDEGESESLRVSLELEG